MKNPNDSLFTRMQTPPNVPQQRHLFSLPLDDFVIKVLFSDKAGLPLYLSSLAELLLTRGCEGRSGR